MSADAPAGPVASALRWKGEPVRGELAKGVLDSDREGIWGTEGEPYTPEAEALESGDPARGEEDPGMARLAEVEGRRFVLELMLSYRNRGCSGEKSR